MRNIIIYLLLTVLCIGCAVDVCQAEETEIVWAIDSLVCPDGNFAASINEAPRPPIQAQLNNCVWVMGWVEIPANQYYQLDYCSVGIVRIPDGVIVDSHPAVRDRNMNRTISPDGFIREQVGVIVYVSKERALADTLNVLFAPGNVSISFKNEFSGEFTHVFPVFWEEDGEQCHVTETPAFEKLLIVDAQHMPQTAKTVIERISPVSKEMAKQHDFQDLFTYLVNGYQCWVVQFRLDAELDAQWMKSFLVQTRDREESFVLANGEYAFMGSFLQGDHIRNGCIDAFLITKSTFDEEDIESIEALLIADELTLYVAPTQLLLSDGLWHLQTPWMLCAPLVSNQGNWLAWE